MDSSVTVRLPAELRKRLRETSRREGKGSSDIVREALRRYLLILEFRRLRAEALPYAEKLGIFTDEDVFKLIS